LALLPGVCFLQSGSEPDGERGGRRPQTETLFFAVAPPAGHLTDRATRMTVTARIAAKFAPPFDVRAAIDLGLSAGKDAAFWSAVPRKACGRIPCRNGRIRPANFQVAARPGGAVGTTDSTRWRSSLPRCLGRATRSRRRIQRFGWGLPPPFRHSSCAYRDMLRSAKRGRVGLRVDAA
jgi:hypothetical protein